MAYRIMIVIEDLEYLPDEREGHLADAGWYGWVGRAGDFTPQIVVDYEEAMAIAEELTVCGPTLQRVFEVRPTRAWKDAGYPMRQMATNQTYYAVNATNQPGWEEHGKIFILGGDCDGMLLESGEYERADRKDVSVNAGNYNH